MSALTLERIREELASYDGAPLRIMEVCGTHTASIVKNGIPSLLSEKIRLISGPGCPVCVTVTAYIDRLTELALTEGTAVCAFGDLLRVRGSSMSLADAKARGGRVHMVYSPAQMLDLAEADPQRTYVFAAVGFETTIPVYAILIQEAERRGIRNVKLLTSLKTMPQVIGWLMDSGAKIDGFIAPGHVCAVAGYEDYITAAAKYGVPFVVSGFEGPQLLATIYALVKMQGRGEVRNLYPGVVEKEGSPESRQLTAEFFEPCDAAWRGMGIIPGSGMRLKDEFAQYDAGSEGLTEDRMAAGCQCARVLTGETTPEQCPLFGKVCTPQDPHGACMVSQEGSCFNHFVARGI